MTAIVHDPLVRTRLRRQGFTFTEVLFAVMILGIGFIMVAAMFPVAIRQTQDTVEEANAGAVARNAALMLQRIATNINFPQTNGVMYSGNTPVIPFYQTLAGDHISTTDPRFAWIPFYSRAKTSTSAQVVIIAVEARAPVANYSGADFTGNGSYVPNLQGRPLMAHFTAHTGPLVADTVMLKPMSGSADYTTFAAEGTYVIVSDDSTRPFLNDPTKAVSCNGYVYRLGNPDPNIPNQWQLMPGSDMKSSPVTRQPTGVDIKVYIVGRGFNTSTNTALGPTMDIAAYSTFIQVH